MGFRVSEKQKQLFIPNTHNDDRGNRTYKVLQEMRREIWELVDMECRVTKLLALEP